VAVDPDSVEDSLKPDLLVPLPSSIREFDAPETPSDTPNDCIVEACALLVSFGFSRTDIVHDGEVLPTKKNNDVKQSTPR
jgi:hypothetical protein